MNGLKYTCGRSNGYELVDLQIFIVTEQCPMPGILCIMVQKKLAVIVTKPNNNNSS
jgi:hypothetical protein